MNDENILTLRLGNPAHGGFTVARHGSQVIMVRHGAPGELVRARVQAKRSKVWFADAIEILEASANRVPHIWPEAGVGGAGGAELGFLNLAAQRAWKSQVLADTLRRIGGPYLWDALPDINFEVIGARGDEENRGKFSRTRVELVVGSDGYAGMYGYRSKRLVPLQELPLAVKAIQELELVGERCQWWGFFQPGERLRAVSPEVGDPVVVAGAEVFDPNMRPSSRRHLIREVPDVQGTIRLQVRADAFHQSHPKAGELLLPAVLSGGVDEQGTVLELYSGSGFFSVPLARRLEGSGRLVTIEGSSAAAADARENLDFDGRPAGEKATVLAGEINAKSIPGLVNGPCKGRVDMVVLDPPRAGAGVATMQAIAHANPQKVVHIACDPAALARDIAVLVAEGMRVESIQAFDLFPHTHHFETVAVLTK